MRPSSGPSMTHSSQGDVGGTATERPSTVTTAPWSSGGRPTKAELRHGPTVHGEAAGAESLRKLTGPGTGDAVDDDVVVRCRGVAGPDRQLDAHLSSWRHHSVFH